MAKSSWPGWITSGDIHGGAATTTSGALVTTFGKHGVAETTTGFFAGVHQLPGHRQFGADCRMATSDFEQGRPRRHHRVAVSIQRNAGFDLRQGRHGPDSLPGRCTIMSPSGRLNSIRSLTSRFESDSGRSCLVGQAANSDFFAARLTSLPERSIPRLAREAWPM